MTMKEFLSAHRDELIERCKAKVAKRPRRAATAAQLARGVPLFLDQLGRTLEAEEDGRAQDSLSISGAEAGMPGSRSEIGASAATRGAELLRMGFTVEAVVHDYGDLCQAITDLAVERGDEFSADQFRTLNRCLDNAVAAAVGEFGSRREALAARDNEDLANLRLGELAHELRNALQTARLAFRALEAGPLAASGATGGLVSLSLSSMASLLDESLAQARGAPAAPADEVFSVAELFAEAARAAGLQAGAAGRALASPPRSSASRATAPSSSPRWATCFKTPSSSPAPAPR